MQASELNFGFYAVRRKTAAFRVLLSSAGDRCKMPLRPSAIKCIRCLASVCKADLQFSALIVYDVLLIVIAKFDKSFIYKNAFVSIKFLELVKTFSDFITLCDFISLRTTFCNAFLKDTMKLQKSINYIMINVC